MCLAVACSQGSPRGAMLPVPPPPAPPRSCLQEEREGRLENQQHLCPSDSSEHGAQKMPTQSPALLPTQLPKAVGTGPPRLVRRNRRPFSLWFLPGDPSGSRELNPPQLSCLSHLKRHNLTHGKNQDICMLGSYSSANILTGIGGSNILKVQYDV